MAISVSKVETLSTETPMRVFLDSFKEAGHRPAFMENSWTQGWSRVSCWHCDDKFIWWHGSGEWVVEVEE